MKKSLISEKTMEKRLLRFLELIAFNGVDTKEVVSFIDSYQKLYKRIDRVQPVLKSINLKKISKMEVEDAIIEKFIFMNKFNCEFLYEDISCVRYLSKEFLKRRIQDLGYWKDFKSGVKSYNLNPIK